MKISNETALEYIQVSKKAILLRVFFFTKFKGFVLIGLNPKQQFLEPKKSVENFPPQRLILKAFVKDKFSPHPTIRREGLHALAPKNDNCQRIHTV
jgi:hypothetical protein